MADAQDPNQVPLLRPIDSSARQVEKLQKIVSALMQRVERSDSDGFNSYSYFQTSVALEEQVRERTRDLEKAIAELNQSKAQIADAQVEAERARADMSDALEVVKEGFAIFDHKGILIMSNRRFSRLFPDVVPKISPGLLVNDYLKLISKSRALVLESGTSAQAWLKERKQKLRQEHAGFVVELVDDRWIQISQQRTPNGGTAILQTEVTDMVRLARQEHDRLLEDQAKIVRATFDHINQGICIFDEEDRLAGWNNRFLTMMNPSMNLIRAGIHFDRFVQHFSTTREFKSLEATRKIIEWVQNRDKKLPLEIEIERVDGAIVDVFCDTTPDNGFVMSFTDVTIARQTTAALHEVNENLEVRVRERTTEMKIARDAAERANTSKSRFLAATSHDLLQPINAAKLFISALSETSLDRDQMNISNRLTSAFDSIETILGALLDISKLDAGAKPAISVFPLNRLLVPLRDEFQALAQDKGIQFHVVDCGLDVVSDPAYLRRIVQNLASNAVAYTDSGKVLIGARRRGQELRIEVIDTGPGIPEDQQERVFHEFHRIKRPKEIAPGMGLGLAIVNRACDLLGHPLRMHSQVGYGTRFSVSVPYREPAVLGVDSDANEAAKISEDLAGMILLVIENEAAVRTGMLTLLDRWGASPIGAENLAEAIQLIDELDVVPDAILADYHLNDNETGVEAIRALRRRHGQIPSALITANRSDHLATSIAKDAVLLLHKPLQPDRLRAFLAQLKQARQGNV